MGERGSHFPGGPEKCGLGDDGRASFSFRCAPSFRRPAHQREHRRPPCFTDTASPFSLAVPRHPDCPFLDPPPSSSPFHSDVSQALVSPVMLSLLWRLWVGGMREASKSVFLSQKQKKTEQNNAHCLGPISSDQESPEVWRTGRAGALSWVMGYGIMLGQREPRAVPRLSSHCR